MTSRAQSQCAPSCARYMSPFNPANTTGVKACSAFPGGIPERIWQNQLDHRQPIDGDRGLQWLAVDGYTFPEYALAPDAVGQGVVVAAGEPQTGAMVALLPADPQQFAVDGGEPATELHCTLIYLGEAAQFDEQQRADIVAACQDLATGWGVIEADAFSVAMFNPNGDEPCIVLGLTGQALAEFFDLISEMVEPSADQHQPWTPHITIIYGNDPAMVGQLTDKTGPVNFDRLRVAFAGEVTDIPLVEEDYVPEDDGVPAVEAPPEAPAEAPAVAAGRVRWDGCPRCFREVHDGPCTSVFV